MAFEDVLLPFVLCYRDDVARLVGDRITLLNERAAVQLERQLLRTLSHWALLPLYLEFDTDRRMDVDESWRSVSGAFRYREFARTILHTDDGIRFFLEYAVLARILTLTTTNAVDATVDLVHRFAEDRCTLSLVSGSAENFTTIAEVDAGLSDPHHHGRSVMHLTLSSGSTVIYKPRSVLAEDAFATVLQWLNRETQIPEMRVLRVLARNGYGWMEFANAFPCETDAERKQFYMRLGTLLCVAYVLGGTDFHFENIVASGPHPVLVDLEVLCIPDVAHRGHQHAPERFALSNSVLRTGFLPSTSGSAVRPEDYDSSAIGAGVHQTPYPWYLIERINSDAMSILFRRFFVAPTNHRPSAGTDDVLSESDMATLVMGFTKTYELLSERKETLLCDDGPLAQLLDGEFRFVPRPTRTYARLLQRLTRPECLRDRAAFGAEVAALERKRASPDAEDVDWVRIGHCEQDAIARLDIPYFTFDATRRCLMTDGQVVADDFFAVSGQDKVRTRINEMGSDDLAFQLRIMRASMHLARRSRAMAVTSADQRPTHGDTSLTAEDDCRAVARRIGEVLLSEAVQTTDGGAIWISFGQAGNGDTIHVEQCDDSLYAGRLGIALFLAALARETSESKFRAGALAALRGVTSVLTGTQEREQPRSLGVGGVAGSILGLLVCQRYLQDAGIADALECVVDHIRRYDGADDTVYDVISGSAGLILALSSYYEAMGDRSVEPVLVALGDRLVAQRVSVGGGHAWVTIPGEQPLNGFAHGSAGIGYALATLYRLFGRRQHLQAFREACAFEDETTSATTGIWRDLRKKSVAESIGSWCHGAAGIGLARAASSEFRGSGAVGEVERAFSYLRSTPAVIDSLCCGAAGHVDVLVEAGVRLARPDFIENARNEVLALAARATATGGFQLFSGTTPAQRLPAFFTGGAGIGYCALRAASPHVHPSILLGCATTPSSG